MTRRLDIYVHSGGGELLPQREAGSADNSSTSGGVRKPKTCCVRGIRGIGLVVQRNGAAKGSLQSSAATMA